MYTLPQQKHTHTQLQYLILLETGFSKILLNMNAFSLLPLMLASISKPATTRLQQQTNTPCPADGEEVAPTSSSRQTSRNIPQPLLHDRGFGNLSRDLTTTSLEAEEVRSHFPGPTRVAASPGDPWHCKMPPSVSQHGSRQLSTHVPRGIGSGKTAPGSDCLGSCLSRRKPKSEGDAPDTKTSRLAH